MTEQLTALPAAGGWKRDLACLGLLLALIVPLRVWLLVSTEVPARDCVGFIRYALQFEEMSWQEVLRRNHQHPGYPLTIWAASQPVRFFAGHIDSVIMQISAQLASGIAAVLLIFPMYFLGKALFDRPVAFWATLIFQYLPASGHHLSDGISEPLFLLLVASALLWGVLGIRDRSPLRLAICGFFCGLAYLTRPEGALTVAAAGLVLAAMQGFAAVRMSWPRFAACGASLCTTAILVGGIYVIATGHLSQKPAVFHILKGAPDNPNAGVPQFRPQARIVVRPAPLTASMFGAFFQKTDGFPARIGRSLQALFMEVNQALHYIAGIPALLGIWWSWSRLRRLPEFWVPAAYLCLQCSALMALAMTEYYVSERHVMPLVLCGSYFVAAGLIELPRRVLGWISGWTSGGAQAAQVQPVWRTASFWSLTLLIGLLLFAAPKTVQRLHGNRTGNLVAGRWLAEHLREGDHVDDDHAWSHFYAGMVFKEGKEQPLPAGYVPTSYVVVTRSRDRGIGPSRDDKENKAMQRGHVVYFWPENQNLHDARVVIISMPRDPNQFPWTVRNER